MCTVLAVTDDRLTGERLAKVLKGMDLEVVFAASEFEVNRACLAKRPGIVVADIESAGGIGYEAISLARRNVRDAYIIAVSRENHQEIWSRVAMAFGADEYVPGHLSASQLVTAIETCNRGRNAKS